MLSTVSLFVATPEQKTVLRRRAAAQWGQGITVDEFLEREVAAENEEYGRDGKLISWVLAPRDDPTTLDFFSSCRTFKRRIVICYPPQPAQESTIEEDFGYAVSSVLTAPHHRGKGYGSHMMRLLHWVLAHEDYLSTHIFPEEEWGPKPHRVDGAGDGRLSILYSDVGSKFYKECGMGVGHDKGDGWVVENSGSAVWKLREVDLPVEEAPNDAEKVIWLDEDLVKGVWESDAEQIKLDLVKNAEQGKVQFAILPNGGVAYYLWSRLHYHFSRYVQSSPKICGLKIGEQAFATWTFDYRPDSPKMLIVTRLRASGETAQRLIEYILRYAQTLEMEQVEIWNPPQGDILGLGRTEREEHLSSIKWYSKGVEAEWIFNERYNWC